MSGQTHSYHSTLTWLAAGDGHHRYQSYSRAHQVRFEGKPILSLTADPAFLGDPSGLNPEELLLAALSSCHLLCFLARCAQAGLRPVSYSDGAQGEMTENGVGGGAFTEVLLRPSVAFATDGAPTQQAFLALHHKAAKDCFIAASVNFPVKHAPALLANQTGA